MKFFIYLRSYIYKNVAISYHYGNVFAIISFIQSYSSFNKSLMNFSIKFKFEHLNIHLYGYEEESKVEEESIE